MILPLIEKYRAKCFDDIKGQDLEIQEVKNFFNTFPKKRALILNGPVGTGKTSMVLALAKESGLEIFELNASDLRNKKSLEAVLRPSIEQQSLFNKGKLILMDEADGITGSDRGGVPELIALITKTSFPIIITANDIWQKKFSLLRQKCKIVNLKELNETIIFEILNKISIKENKEVNKETLNLIARTTKGDVRAALNDLQSIIDLGETEFLLEFSSREKQESIFDALKQVFQSDTTNEITQVYNNTHLQLDEILLWVEENIPLEYSGKALAKAYDILSRADLFKGRIYRQQHWRFLVYENFFLSAGISSVTKLKNKRFISYNKPSRILKIWLSNQKNAKIKSITTKYAKFTHMSKKKANKERHLLPFILNNLDKRTKNKLDFDEKEEEYLKEKKIDLIISKNLNRFSNKETRQSYWKILTIKSPR